MTARILIIAGSDSGGGAGIQADVKTVGAMGGYAATAITALTAQNTQGVADILPTPPAFVARQVQTVLDDMGIRVIKTGMMVNAAIINAVADVLPEISMVVDPVMVSKNGTALLDADGITAMTQRLFPKARLLTPNIPEAEVLLGRTIRTETDQSDAARALLDLGPQAVLLKGGHRPDGDQVFDFLATSEGVVRFTSPRLPGPAVHGTGCTLASGIAASMAQGLPLMNCIIRAHKYLHNAIKHSLTVGNGHPVLHHFHGIDI